MSTDATLLDPELVSQLANERVDVRNAQLLELARNGAFDFVDLGTHRGGGIKWGNRLGGACGLGIEMNPKRAQKALAAGFPVYTGDIAAFPTDGLQFRFAVCRHVLEHMPNRYVVGFILWKLSGMCTDFIYIEQPIFDYAERLDEHGVTLAHFTMRGHTCRLSINEFLAVLEGVGITRYVQGGMRPIEDSSSRWVHPAGAPPDRSHWQEGVDPPRPEVKFEPPLHRDFVVLAALGNVDLQDILRRVRGFELQRSVGVTRI